MKLVTAMLKLDEIIAAEKKSKVYIKLRTPIIGKFVKMNDYHDLINKGWVRFVSEGNMWLWDTCHKEHVTRLFKVEDIVDIKDYVNVD